LASHTLETMKRRSPTQSTCVLLKRRSRCHSPKLLCPRRRKRRSQPQRAPLSRSRRRKKSHRRKRSSQPSLSRSHRGPLLRSHQRRTRSQHPPCRSPAGRKGMPCPCTGLGKFFAHLFFLKNTGDSSHPFSHKCGRFIGLEPDLC
jgi:hypothetical protein